MKAPGLAARRYVRIGRGSRRIVLPSGPVRATLAGLTLFEPVEPAQHAVWAGVRAFIRTGLQAVLPRSRLRGFAWAWWQEWISDVAEPLLGPIGHIAVRLLENGRVCVLLMDEDGRPLGFGKILDSPTPELCIRVLNTLDAALLDSFRVPRLLAEGLFEDARYKLFQALPEGPHRRPPFDPPRVREVLDELTAHLSAISRPAAVPGHHVLCHSGFTPRNLRVASDGNWWLFDFDGVRWGPRLAPEVRYWSAEFAYRWRPRVERDALRVLALMRERGSDAAIREAARWPGSTYRPLEGDIRLQVAKLVRLSGARVAEYSPSLQAR